MPTLQIKIAPEFKWKATDLDGDIGLFTHKPYQYKPFDAWMSDEGKDISIQGAGKQCKNWETSLEYIGDKDLIEIEVG